MEYAQAVTYLYDRLPVFHREGAKALKPGLGNTEALCRALGDPHTRFRSIHVAGTNGKGSTSHLLASVYQAAGYRVGLYTSPHLKSFTERIRINGEPIADAAVAAFVTNYQALIESVEPSFFEVTVAMAFDYFARSAVDIAIIEVGLGGRLDSTNVITPLVSVITNIGLDHTDLLGTTLPAIAAEKAGIIKAGVPVIIGETQPETTPVFLAKAADCRSTITFADGVYSVINEGIKQSRRAVSVHNRSVPESDQAGEAYLLDLLGDYQLRNLPAVLATVAALQPILPVSGESLRSGLQSVTASTGLKGRFQTLQLQPRVIADTAHNGPGIQALLAAIDTLHYQRLHLVIGFVQDKDVRSVLERLPSSASYYFCQSHTARSLPVESLIDLARKTGLIDDARPGRAYTNVDQALAEAIDQAGATDLIVITGSTYLVAELTRL